MLRWRFDGNASLNLNYTEMRNAEINEMLKQMKNFQKLLQFFNVGKFFIQNLS